MPCVQRLTTTLLLVIAVFAAQSQSVDVVVNPVFYPSNRTNDAWFGFASSVHSGKNVLAVTSPKDSEKAKEAGAVYLFSASKTGASTSFSQVQKIHSPAPAVYDYFGNSIATDGDHLIVGAFRTEIDNVNDAGSAFFYDIINGTAVYHSTLALVSPLALEQAYAGTSVTFSSQTSQIAVSRAGAGKSGVDVFDYSGNLLTTFENHDAGFGTAVVFGTGGIVFVGAPGTGTVYVYTNNPLGSTTFIQSTISSPTPANTSLFGSSLSVSGNSLVVGSPGAARAYVCSYNATSGNWEITQELQSPSVSSNSTLFGTSVAIDGNYIAVGDPIDGPNPAYKWGAVFLFSRANTNSQFTFANKLIGPRDRNSIGLSFGMKLSLSGNSILVPSYYASTSTLFHAGAVFHSYTNCSTGFWGADCLPCTCGANGVCDDGLGGTGKCSSCVSGFFGENCAGVCTCLNGTCNDGISGDGKCISCSTSFYGPNCDNACGCQANATCSDGINGTGICNCDYTKTWGAKCENSCGCVNGVCDATSGKCVSCANGFYGQNCAACLCTNGECDDGITGDGLCTVCNDGYFTRYCTAPCDCHVGSTSGCTIDGVCLCKPGYILDTDKKTCIVPPPPNGDLWNLMPTYGWVLLILFLVILAILMIWLVVILYIRKKKHEKFGGYR